VEERYAFEMGLVRDVRNSHGHEQPASRREATVHFANLFHACLWRARRGLVDTLTTDNQNEIVIDWLLTKRTFRAHVSVCKEWCCGAVEKGKVEVPVDWRN
jgi:hypothetical protein